MYICDKCSIMLKRTKLVEKILNFKDQNIIKVVTGVRRSGKSTLFDLAIEAIQSQGNEHIIRYNFDDPSNELFLDWKNLYDNIIENCVEEAKNYIFLDEIQEVRQFEKVVNGLLLKTNTDVYITGSNAYFLSGELATKLTGRYVEIHVTPLSFEEYLPAFEHKPVNQIFQQYQTEGGFPQLVQFHQAEIQSIDDYLQGIYNTVLIKDVIQRIAVSEENKLRDITRFLFDSTGSIVSYNSIANTLSSSGRKISNHTVESYISALCDAFLFYKVNRFDLKGKKILTSGSKFYCVDLGFRKYALGKAANVDLGHVLENIVFLELKRRSKKVWIGKVGEFEIDFVTENKMGEIEYYQVAYTVREESTLQRELRPFELMKDYHKRTLITADNDPITSYEGIEKINVLEWLLRT